MPTYIDHNVMATPDERVVLLTTAARQGRLVSSTPPVPLPDGRVTFRLRLADTPRTPAVASTGHNRRWKRPALIGTGIAAAVAVLGWLAYLLVTWVIAHLSVILGGAVVLGIALWGLHSSGVCPGVVVHCRNCNH